MIHSLQTKILLLISVIFIATTASIIFLTQTDVKNAILNTEHKNLENIKKIILLNVEGKYKNLLLDKLAFIKRRKTQLQSESALLMKSLDLLYQLNPDTDETLAKKNVLDWLSTLEISSEIFLADASHDIFFHSNGILDGKNITRIKDIKSKPVSQSINTKNSFLNKFAVFSCENQKTKKIAYLTHLPHWKWTLGITNDISEIEAENREKINDIIKVLRENFKQIKIAETGTIFLFNHSGDLLVPPSGTYLSALTTDVIQTLMGHTDQDTPATFSMGEKNINAYTSRIKALDWYITALVPVEEIRQPANQLAARLSTVIAVIFLLGFFVLSLAVKRFSNPLKLLTQKIKHIPHGDLTAPEFTLNLKKEFYTGRKDEVGALASSFLYMFQELQTSITQLISTTTAKERIESELNVARDIQLGILPKIFPPYPEKKEFDLHAYLEPAREVGGDLFDFFMMDEDHLCISIGDVSDKGVPAALFMVITKTLIKTYAETTDSTSTIITKINDLLSKDNPNCMFVTLLVGILNIKTGVLRYSNAGHNPPIIKSGNHTFFQKGLSGPMAGAMEGMAFKELSVTLKPGDILFFYTDGVTEAMNADQELYSDKKLLELIDTSNHLDAKAIIERVNHDLTNFSKEAPQSDDITMLSLIFKGTKPGDQNPL